MDELVIRAMQRWPNVPAVFGWLRLSRRGEWLIKSRSGGFERIANPALNAFIGRNYLHDERGRWYFQNGPQRVFVALDYTPWVYRLDDAARGLIAHSGATPRTIARLYLDDADSLLVETDLGIGVVLDRDLAAILERVEPLHAASVDLLLEAAARGEEAPCRLFGT